MTLHKDVKSPTYSKASYQGVAAEEIELPDSIASTHFHNQISQPQISLHFNEVDRKQRSFWRRTFEEIKNAPWRWIFRRFFSHILPLLIICGLSVFLAKLSDKYFFAIRDDPVCQLNGSFSITNGGYSPWTRDAVFAINIRFGTYSFSTAKFIDIVWDIIVGRGGQALLAVFSYQAFTKFLSYQMEKSDVPHETFKALAFDRDTFTAVLRLIQTFFRIRGCRVKLAMLWIILATLFVLSVPTWLSAMTGYTAALTAVITDAQGNFVPAEKFLQVVYIIHDGDRLGHPYTKGYHAVVPWNYGQMLLSVDPDCPSAYLSSAVGGTNAWKDIGDEPCTLMWRLSNYTATYGFLGRNNTNTTFTFPDQSSVDLPPPSLNVSAYFAQARDDPEITDVFVEMDWYIIPYGRAWLDPETNNHPYLAHNPLFYSSDSNTEYNEEDLNAHGSCITQNDVKYRWGFSYILLYVFILVLIVWIAGMYILYLNSYLHSRLDRTQRSMGTERAALDLSAAMQKKLTAEHAELYSNSRLNQLVRNNVITYKDLPLEPSLATRWTLVQIWWRDFRVKPWMKSEKWWLMALVVFFTLLILSWKNSYVNSGWNQNVSFLPVLGVLHVLMVGRATGSRWLIFTLWFALFLLFNILCLRIGPWTVSSLA